jgi:hypothetical protein
MAFGLLVKDFNPRYFIKFHSQLSGFGLISPGVGKEK